MSRGVGMTGPSNGPVATAAGSAREREAQAPSRQLWWRRWLREPLVHFLAIGAFLFLAFEWRGGAGSGSGRIVITPGQIDAMAATFARTWQRPPTEAELKGLIDDYVRSEMATREALALGLDRDDTVIRRRLRQKLEFLVEDAADAAPPTDAELQGWLDQHPEAFRVEPRIGFRQVYLDPGRRGPSLDGDVRALLARLTAAGPSAAVDTLGDRLMVPQEPEAMTPTDIAGLFGREFADEVVKIAPGRWVGPVRSGYGVHLVYVRERTGGRTPALEEVRPVVERELLAARRKRQLDAMYDRLLERYRVTIERRAGAGAGKPVIGSQ